MKKFLIAAALVVVFLALFTIWVSRPNGMEPAVLSQDTANFVMPAHNVMRNNSRIIAGGQNATTAIINETAKEQPHVLPAPASEVDDFLSQRSR